MSRGAPYAGRLGEGPLAAPPRTLCLLAVAGGLLLTGCGDAARSAREQTARTPPAVQATPPRISPDTEASPPPRRLSPAPRPGSVRMQPGPFSERLRFVRMMFRSGDRPEVTGRVTAPNETGDLLSLEVRADFYDRRGRLVASGSQRFGEGKPIFDAAKTLRLRPRTRVPAAVSAVVSVPDFVPE